MRSELKTIESNRINGGGQLKSKANCRRVKCVRSIYNSVEKKPEFQEELLNAERNLLKGSTSKAIKTMEDLLTAKSELVRYNASDILDRTGHKPTDKVEAEVVTPTFVSDADR